MKFKGLEWKGIFCLLLISSIIGCGGSTEDNVVVTSEGSSPFGIHMPYVIDNTTLFDNNFITNSLVDINAEWIRIFEGDLGGTGTEALSQKINVLSLVIREKGLTTEIVEQYKDKIKYWEAGNEPDLPAPDGIAPADYVPFLRDVYEKVKSVCGDCMVVLGGLKDGTQASENSKGPVFLKSILELGAARYFDIFNFHAGGKADAYLDLSNTIAVYRGILAQYQTEKSIWITEMSTYDGDPLGADISYPSQTEIQQASGLVKRYVYSLKLGVKKIFWNLIVERNNFGGITNSYFDYVGLVNNPANDGLSYNKLAYYTYKKMVEVLEGSNWDTIQGIQETNGVYIYKFDKAGKPIWVVWNDNLAVKEITISVGSDKVKITEAVPKYGSGIEIVDYNTGFEIKTESVTGGKITMTLGDKPVFVEAI
ncbi:MAG: hypothetical protein HY887_09880 [Deltaproteobacteria bacterium]|nr:hypothetical protein [Deltaproteobacteria bacterium]